MQIGLLIVSAAFLTSILSGIFGMAGGLIFMGLLTWVLPVSVALALHGLIQFMSNFWRVALYHRHVRWPVLLWFGIGAVAAMATFTWVIFTPSKFYVFLGLGLMPILVWIPERWVRLDASCRPHALVGGFISTGISLVSGVSGPVTDLLFIRTQLNRHEVVATKAAMQAMGHASKILVYGAVLLSPAVRADISLAFSAAAILASMAGIMVGGVILNRISDAYFQAARRWIVTIIGLTFLFQAAEMMIR